MSSVDFGDYEERVIASCAQGGGKGQVYLEQYSTILTDISERFQPIFGQISPALDESSQLQYLKKPRTLACWRASFR